MHAFARCLRALLEAGGLGAAAPSGVDVAREALNIAEQGGRATLNIATSTARTSGLAAPSERAAPAHPGGAVPLSELLASAELEPEAASLAQLAAARRQLDAAQAALRQPPGQGVCFCCQLFL